MRKSDLNGLLAAIAAGRKLYLPVDTDAGTRFVLWQEGVELSHSLNSARSAKDFFFPQTETLMEFKVEGKKIEIKDIREEHEDFALFGVRACDVRGFEVLDRVFLSEPVDSYYKNRREHCTVFSLACTRPQATCFCTTFGIDPANPGADVQCYIDADTVYLEALTDKGRDALDKAGITDECTDETVKAQRDTIGERMNALPLAGLSADAFGAGKTDEYFDSDAWAHLSESCLGCGTCTFVCPTCQCYDIKDFNTGDGIKRFRCWDSCMYSEFTKMSAGQPRLTHKERYRQRFMHKLVYFPENNDGIFGCVGCGRCVAKCPIGMNIVKVMKTLSDGGKADE